MFILYFNTFFNYSSFFQDFLLTFVAPIGVLNRGKVSPKIPDSCGNVTHAKSHPNSLRLVLLADQRRLKAFFLRVRWPTRTNWRIKSRKSLTKNPRLPRKCQACGRDFQEFKSKKGIRFNVHSVFQHVFQLFFIFSGLFAHFRRTNWRIKSRKSLTKNPRLLRKCHACEKSPEFTPTCPLGWPKETEGILLACALTYAH